MLYTESGISLKLFW